MAFGEIDVTGEPRMVFLVGTMRSGTTFLRNLIGSHPSVLSLGSELNRFWTEQGGAPCGVVPQCSARRAEDLIPEVRNRVYASFALRERWKNAPGAIAYRLYRQCRHGNESLWKRGAPFYLLNKNTHFGNKIPYLNALFPGAMFVFLLREIYASCASLRTHLEGVARGGWRVQYPHKEGACWSFEPRRSGDGDAGKGLSMMDVATYWLEQNALAMRALSDVDESRKLFVSYESLATEPGAELGRVEAFLSLPTMNRRLNIKRINWQSSAPLTDWKQLLNEDEQAQIAACLKARREDRDAITSGDQGPNTGTG